MAEHPDIDRHRKGHAAFRGGDMEYLKGIFAEDTVWHWSGNNQISGDHVGRDAVFALFDKLAELAGDSIELEDHDFLGNDKHTVALVRYGLPGGTNRWTGSSSRFATGATARS